jgi:predicted GH43/DUF377 family glycosyl hydrolase
MTKSLIGIFLIAGLLSGCNEQEKETERERTIRLLTNDITKKWAVNQNFTDGIEQAISFCDSSYILTLRADYSWNETFSYISCYRSTDGIWSLNDENNVISINYVSQISGKESERVFEIVELSEEYFAYEYVVNNDLRRVRLYDEKIN